MNIFPLPVPIVQAPMGGGASTPEMAAALANAGGLGSIAGGYLSAEKIKEEVAAVRALTDRPFALNLFVDDISVPADEVLESANEALRPVRDALGLATPARPPLPAENRAEQLEAMLDCRPAVFSFTFGIPSKWVLDECARLGIVTVGTATTVDEALALERAGVDVVCAQGAEAGAHRGTFLRPWEESLVGTMALVPQIVDAVHRPVIAAGGIGDGRGIAAVLALGATAAQLGTAFLLADESRIPLAWREALQSDMARTTVLTTAFSGRVARGIRNHFIDEMADAPIAPYPFQNTLTQDIRAAAARAGSPDFLSLWAGQAARLARPLPSAIIVERLMKEAHEAAGMVCRAVAFGEAADESPTDQHERTV